MSELADASATLKLTSNLIAAFAIETAAAAGAPTRLVSITFDVLSDDATGEGTKSEVRIVRATRTLVFSEADIRNRGGAPLMVASAVHKVLR